MFHSDSLSLFLSRSLSFTPCLYLYLSLTLALCSSPSLLPSLVPPSLFLPPAIIHTHTHAHARIHTHSHTTISLSLTFSLFLALAFFLSTPPSISNACSLSMTLSLFYLALFLSSSCSQLLSLARCLMCASTHARTRTSARAHSLCLAAFTSRSFSLVLSYLLACCPFLHSRGGGVYVYTYVNI